MMYFATPMTIMFRCNFNLSVEARFLPSARMCSVGFTAPIVLYFLNRLSFPLSTSKQQRNCMLSPSHVDKSDVAYVLHRDGRSQTFNFKILLFVTKFLLFYVYLPLLLLALVQNIKYDALIGRVNSRIQLA